MDTTKTKILDIQTGKAEKNVKSLKTQIRELKEQLAGLEKNTAEYDKVAKQLADTNQRQIEINEAMKYSNQDFGQTMSNLTKVAGGVIGAINGINAVMTMMAGESEEAQKAVKNIQLTMALIQGLSAIDDANKSLEGLGRAFGFVGGKATKAGAEVQVSEDAMAAATSRATAAAAQETRTVAANTAAKGANATATNTMSKAETTAAAASTRLATRIRALGASLKAFALTNPFTVLLAGAAAVMGVFTLLKRKTDEATEANREQKASVDDLVKSYYDLSGATDDLNFRIKWNADEKTQKEVDKLIGKFYKFAAQTQYAGVQSQKVWEAFYAKIDKDGTKLEKRLLGLANAQYNYTQSGYAINRAQNEEDLNAALEAQVRLEEKRNAVYGKYMQAQKQAAASAKPFREMLNEYRTLYRQFMETTFSWDSWKAVFNGMYDEAALQLEKIRNLVKAGDLGKALTEQFRDALDNGTLKDLDGYNVTLDLIFNPDTIRETERKLAEEQSRLEALMKTPGTSKELESQKKEVARLKEQVAAYGELAEAVKKYADIRDEAEKKRKGTENQLRQIEQERDIYDSWWLDTLRNNPWAEINRTLATTEASLNNVKEELSEIAREEESISGSGTANQAAEQRVQELADKRRELEQRQVELERTLEETNHEIRLKHIEEEFEKEKKNTEALAQGVRDRDTALGGGTDNYSTETSVLQTEMEGIERRKNIVKKYYQELMANVTQGSEQWIQLEAERDAALTQLEKEGAEQRVKIVQSEAEGKQKALKSYIGALSSLSSQISGILSAEMANYDETSEEYKNLKYAQGVTDTLSGTLAAFMSGVQSGLQAPFNFILGGVLSAMTFAAGMAQLRNIKEGTLANSTAATPASANVGSEYDTISYEQNNDILSSIQDSRVWVLEQDISEAQNRVQVREVQSTF